MAATKLDISPKLAELEGFSLESKVWYYIANKPLDAAAQAMTQEILARFVQQWTAHNKDLKAAAELYAGRIILLMVDESQAGASGCSIDKSVHLLQRLGQELGLDFFDPFTSAWLDEDHLFVGSMDDLKAALKANRSGIQIVNSQVKTKFDLQKKWLLTLEGSWQSKFVG